jgi:FKBP-type peptidyl-prolyl cis-trans isomerase
VVIVTDINASFPGRATGADRAPQAGFPAVVLAPNGQPGFTTPATAPPSALKFATLKQGSGARVTEGDTILVNLTGIGWGAKATFLSSWDIGGPSRVIASDMTMIERGVPAGLAEAIIGQKVGSQIIAVVPPALGYPAGSAPEGVTPTSTVVFLVDILRID